MGYTHYWYRPRKISEPDMQAIAGDFARLVLALDDMGVKIADGLGHGTPTITPELVWFNGVENCGHAKNESVSIPWPDARASGVNDSRNPVSGSWFAGALLSTRTCNGDCSYETFNFPREMEADSYWQSNERHKDLFFNCTKTAFRPYDLAVTAFLIIAKHHLGERIIVSSDGEDENWMEAKQVCQAFLDYGMEYRLDEELMRAA